MRCRMNMQSGRTHWLRKQQMKDFSVMFLLIKCQVLSSLLLIRFFICMRQNFQVWRWIMGSIKHTGCWHWRSGIKEVTVLPPGVWCWMKKEKMKPADDRVIAWCYLECFDNVARVTGRTSGLYETLLLILTGSVPK